MRVWLTGATGLTGGALVELLSKQGYEVWALVRPGARRDSLVRAGVHVLQGTLPDVTPFSAAPSPDVIFHCAAAWLPDGAGWVERCRAVHVEALRSLAELAIERGARLVSLSSVSAMGYGTERVHLDEASPCRPRDEYGRVKLEGDALLEKMGERGLDYITLRPAVVYGPRSRGDVVLGTIDAIARRRFFLMGRGDAPISLVFSGNLAAAMLHVAGIRLSSQRILLVDDGRPTTRAELASDIAREVGCPRSFLRMSPRVARLAGRVSDVTTQMCGMRSPFPFAAVEARLQSYAFDTSALRRTGFRPPFTREAALRETLAWWRSACRGS
jgi:nucleoside-diphosphate-sugar epimerase